MAVKAAINGFGRIGRLVFRAALNDPSVEIVAINDLTGPATNAHLLKYDSTHGQLKEEISSGGDNLTVGGKIVKVLAEKDPANLPWNALGVDVVIEASGKFTDAEKAKAHLGAGAKKVIISAPAKNEDITIVMGVNENSYDPLRHNIISNASCTTNCLAPAAKVINDKFGIVKGLMTTVHAYTNDQRILDQEHKDLRRARSAGASIIPTTTGAAKAVSLVLPELKGKLNGFAMRVPTQNVSVVDLVVELAKTATAEDINAALSVAAKNELAGILSVCELPLVSTDFNGDPHSSVVDALSTMVIGDNLAKLVLWYDNEWAYSCRVVDLLLYIAARF
ncbi:MAG: type I glyceraldehyde-3-phosphate dehydrogenase [Clostridiales bacterium]|nr:type I glyceraldehyde-3-phosphate dehydrogenase [Clostridiales bacterium]